MDLVDQGFDGSCTSRLVKTLAVRMICSVVYLPINWAFELGSADYGLAEEAHLKFIGPNSTAFALRNTFDYVRPCRCRRPGSGPCSCILEYHEWRAVSHFLAADH